MEGIIPDFERAMADEVARLDKRICGGSCKSMEDYREKCGERRAYHRAVDKLREIVKRYYETDEKDNLKEETR